MSSTTSLLPECIDLGTRVEVKVVLSLLYPITYLKIFTCCFFDLELHWKVDSERVLWLIWDPCAAEPTG